MADQVEVTVTFILKFDDSENPDPNLPHTADRAVSEILDAVAQIRPNAAHASHGYDWFLSRAASYTGRKLYSELTYKRHPRLNRR